MDEACEPSELFRKAEVLEQVGLEYLPLRGFTWIKSITPSFTLKDCNVILE